ncbi:MAG TPA: hypothetical protein ENL34_01380 [Chloroflexi bacterium]|nr:hypothetical protein [Chloroflexota bacterium]
MTKKKQPQHIDTGGGAYIGGDVKAEGDFVGRDQVIITGDGNVVGDQSSATVIKQVTEGATLEEFLRLLAELRQALPAAGLDPDTAEVIEADVQVVEEQAQKEKPSTAVIVAKLKSIAEVLTASGAVATAAQKLLPVAQQALTWAQQLFH